MSTLLDIRNRYKDYSLDSYINSDKIDAIEQFLEMYNKIQKQDFIKPIFSLTKKYSNYSNKKIDSDWKGYVPKNKDEEIEEIIKSNMNKISKITFNLISKNLISDIKKVENSNVLGIVSNEIYEKTIFDIKFQSIYLDVINIIWSDKSFYHNLVNIKKEKNKFYWVPKNNMSNKFRGPFDNIKDLDNDVYDNLSLKKIFINKLQDEFNKRDEYIETIKNTDIEDTDRYKSTRQLLGFYEIVVKLYYGNQIPLFMINYILSRLFKSCQRVHYIELIHTLLKLFTSHKYYASFMSNNSMSSVLKKSHIQQYMSMIVNVDKSEFPKRELFMIMDIKDYLNKMSGSFTCSNKGTVVKTINFDAEIKDNLLKNHYKKITYMLKSNMNVIEKNLLILFDYLFEYQSKRDTVNNIVTYLLTNKYLKREILENVMTEIESNLDDIELDISNVKTFYNDFKKDIMF